MTSNKVTDVEVFEVNDVDEIDVSKIPLSDMSFNTKQEAEEYYEEYGRQNGFDTRIRTSTTTSVQFVCATEGKYEPKKNLDNKEGNDESDKVKGKKKKRNSTQKCGCEAQMRVTYSRVSDKWHVTVSNETHNHSFISPSKRMKMTSNKKFPKAVKNLAEAFHEENINLCKVSRLFGGEYMGFDDRKVYNFLRNVRFKNMDVGDAHSVLTYFMDRQVQNPNFFYAIQHDEFGRAANFFWVDSRSRMAYECFGDVVSFDTTYRTNKYKMPFVPFTGVNHHWQSIQFGCALLQDETEISFTWLFKNWLIAMGGRPPIAILTDQDLAMKGAISKVFPNTRHRLCIWHILKKFGEKLNHVYNEKSKFKNEIERCIWSTYKKEEFEERWSYLMRQYGLESNEWMQHLYAIRESWVPVFNRDIFFAGMNTTGRSEGVNSFFNEFVTLNTNLKEFVFKYEKALKKIIQKESDEDFVSEHKNRIVKDNEFLLKHAANVYTRNLLNKFKDEFDEVSSFKVEEKKNTDESVSYLVTSKVNDHQNFIVRMDPQTYAGSCECKKFEFVGLLCRHILKVFVRLEIDVIPEIFILPRCRKKANKFRITDTQCVVNGDTSEKSEVLRLNHLCRESTKLACLAASSPEAYMFYVENLKYLSKNIVRICDENKVTSNIENNDLQPTELPQILLLDPNISQTKGRKAANEKDNKTQTGRIKSGVEIGLEKKRRLCKGCNKHVRHDWRTCPQNPKNKANKALEDEEEFIDLDEGQT